MPLGGLSPCPFPLGGNAESGWRATEHARACADLSAVVATAPIILLWGNTNSTDISAYVSQWSIGVADSPPTVTINASGDVSVEWESGYLDDYDNHLGVSIRHVEVSISGTSIPSSQLVAMGEIEAPNKVRIRTKVGATLTASDFFAVLY